MGKDKLTSREKDLIHGYINKIQLDKEYFRELSILKKEEKEIVLDVVKKYNDKKLEIINDMYEYE